MSLLGDRAAEVEEGRRRRRGGGGRRWQRQEFEGEGWGGVWGSGGEGSRVVGSIVSLGLILNVLKCLFVLLFFTWTGENTPSVSGSEAFFKSEGQPGRALQSKARQRQRSSSRALDETRGVSLTDISRQQPDLPDQCLCLMSWETGPTSYKWWMRASVRSPQEKEMSVGGGSSKQSHIRWVGLITSQPVTTNSWVGRWVHPELYWAEIIMFPFFS